MIIKESEKGFSIYINTKEMQREPNPLPRKEVKKILSEILIKLK